MISRQFNITSTRQKLVSAHTGAQYVYLHVEGNNEIYLGGGMGRNERDAAQPNTLIQETPTE